MSAATTFKRLCLVAAVAAPAFASLTLPGPASANVLTDGGNGAVCKGQACFALQLNCEGFYVGGAGPEGVAYGRCTQTVRKPLAHAFRPTV